MNELVRYQLANARPMAKIYRAMSPRGFTGRLVGVWLVTAIAVCSPAPMLGLLAYLGVLLGMLGLSVVLVRRRRKRSNQIWAESERGVELLELGRTVEAAEIFDDLCERSRGLPWYHALMVANRGAVHLRCSEFDQARELIIAALNSGWMRPGAALANVAPKLFANLCLVDGLVGKLDRAEAWRAEGRSRGGSLDRDWLLPEVVIDARAERYERVVHRLDEARETIEGTMTVSRLRHLELVKAFCLEHLCAGEYRSQWTMADVDRSLHGIRPGTLDYFAHGWPDMHAFMRRHRILSAEA